MALGCCVACQRLVKIVAGGYLKVDPNGGGDLPTRARSWHAMPHSRAVHERCSLHLDTSPLPSAWRCDEHGAVDPLAVRVEACPGSGKPI